MLLYLRPRWNHVLKSALTWREETKFSGGEIWTVWEMVQRFAAGRLKQVPSVLCRVRSGNVREEKTKTFPRTTKQDQISKWETMLNCCSCAPAHVPRESRGLEHKNPLSGVILYMSTLLIISLLKCHNRWKKISHIRFLYYACPVTHFVVLSW